MQEAANDFQMDSYPLLSAWLKKYREQGIERLFHLKRRPPEMTKKVKKHSQPTLETESNRVKALKDHVLSLQIENAYLKELRRSQKKESHEVTKRLHRSSVPSESDLR